MRLASSLVRKSGGFGASRAALGEQLDTARRLWGHPSASREQVTRFRNRKLKALIEHAYANVPYYRRRLDEAGVHPSEIQSVSDLSRLPVTTKADLRNQPVEDIVARGVVPGELVLRYTAGSTGEPTRVRRSVFEDQLLNLFRVRTLHLLGRRVSDRIAKIGSAGVPTDKKPGWLTTAASDLGLYKFQHIDGLRAPAEVARDLTRLEPDVIEGYPGIVAEVAALWPTLGRGRRGPRVVYAGGELMTPTMRRRITEGLKTRVLDTYGSHEFNMLGWECPVSGLMHVCDDNVVIEVIRDGLPAQPGECGELLVTGLHSYSAPYIRYALGDIVTVGGNDCACGLPFSTIRDVQGRVMDYCVLPNGRHMHHWELIPMTFWDMPWHRRYQMVQETTHSFALRVVVDASPPLDDVDHLETCILEKLGPSATFRLECVDELEAGLVGKHRLCRSGVSHSAVSSR